LENAPEVKQAVVENVGPESSKEECGVEKRGHHATTTTILWLFSGTIRVSRCQKNFWTLWCK